MAQILKQVCDFSKPPFAKWFVGGETNLCHNAVDRHLPLRANQPALHYLSTEVDAEQSMAASMRHVFAGEPGQTMFTAADIGWAVGHSYTVYGPLIHGMQSVLYEGLPTRPDGGIWWRIVEKYGVSVMFTSPTAIRD